MNALLAAQETVRFQIANSNERKRDVKAEHLNSNLKAKGNITSVHTTQMDPKPTARDETHPERKHKQGNCHEHRGKEMFNINISIAQISR